MVKKVENANKNDLYYISKNIVSPVLISYTLWLLKTAKSRGISTLYFLARDGYVLREIALQLSKKYDFDIDCRYLYCSRAALRSASFHLADQEGMNLLFYHSNHVTLSSLFQRMNMPFSLQEIFLNDWKIEDSELTRKLSSADLEYYKEKFRNHPQFQSYITEWSRSTYTNTINYFHQEELFNQPIVAIVDSGWSGTIQRGLRQLLISDGYKGKIIGFYFGLYQEPKPEDGEYLPWFFSKKEHLKNKLLFNNVLFECMLSAPHGMTITYKFNGQAYEPVQTTHPSNGMLEKIAIQIQGILDGVTDFLTTSQNAKHSIAANNHLCRLMTFPHKKEVEAYNDFIFCDDITESRFTKLAADNQRIYLKDCLLSRRLWRKFTHQSKDIFVPFWLYGILAYEPSLVKREWYRFNFLVYDLINLILNRT